MTRRYALTPSRLAAVVTVAVLLPGAFVLRGPAGKVEREWRHYVALRAADRALETWLDESPARCALLFHSTPHASGRRIAEEYPARATMPDASPGIEVRD